MVIIAKSMIKERNYTFISMLYLIKWFVIIAYILFSIHSYLMQ